jgi:hypothetical protein
LLGAALHINRANDYAAVFKRAFEQFELNIDIKRQASGHDAVTPWAGSLK